MKTIREIGEEIERKKIKTKRKDRTILIVGLTLSILALIQLIVLVIYFTEIKGNNQIIYNDQVVTSEVCTLWFNDSTQQTTRNNSKPYMYKSQPIPLSVMDDVCNKWKNIKDEFDNE